jgi:hypothetical protein
MLQLFPLLGLCLCGCRYVQTYEAPYSQIESVLLQRLCIDKADLITSRFVRINVDSKLAHFMGMKIFGVVLRDHVAETRLRFTARHLYDLGAVGRESITFDIQKIDDRRTKVAVNYSDRAVGFLVIPYAYANPGTIREPRIVRQIFESGEPPGCEPMLPRALSEQSCEWLQGRSCGPEGAQIPCTTAGNAWFVCSCTGQWSCSVP